MSKLACSVEKSSRALSRNLVGAIRGTVECGCALVRGTASGAVEGLGVSFRKPDIHIRKPLFSKPKFIHRRKFTDPVIVSDGEYLGVQS